MSCDGGFAYSNGKVRTSLTGAMGMSHVAIFVVTPSYVEAVERSDTRERRELDMAKEFQVPVISFYFDNLNDGERKRADVLFTELKILEKYDVPYEGFDKWLEENMQSVLDKIH